MGWSSTPYSGLPRKTICSHLICPRVLFLMMMTLIGSLCLTAVTNSIINIVKPPSPTNATTCRSGKATCATVRVGKARSHRRQVARTGEFHPPPDFDVSCGPGCDGSGIGRDDRVVGEQVVDMPCDHLRLERHVVPLLPVSHQLPPVLHSRLGFFQERAVTPPFEHRQKRLERRLGVSRQADVYGKTKPDPRCIAVNLHSLRLVGFGQILHVGKTRAGDE